MVAILSELFVLMILTSSMFIHSLHLFQEWSEFYSHNIKQIEISVDENDNNDDNFKTRDAMDKNIFYNPESNSKKPLTELMGEKGQIETQSRSAHLLQNILTPQ